MPEYRQNMATREWVILAPERGGRPKDVHPAATSNTPVPDNRSDCPFCVGNEHLTETPLYAFSSGDDWQVRVVPNKFAALRQDLPATRTPVGAFLSAGGFGMAEVVIEHPRHNRTIATMDADEVLGVLRAYRERQIEISKAPGINLVTVFRNHGARAGTSLEHPHSQIIATPIVPPHVRYPMEQAVMYYDQNGSCVYCDMVAEEIRQRDRIIMASDRFVSFCPFAARSPFECRIYPRAHQPSFVLTSDADLVELAVMLRDLLKKLYLGLGNPDYNYILRSAPVGDHDTRHLHWYLVIVPRISTAAGFEIGSGIYINTVSPEESARSLREVSTTVG
ncbi:MAG: galactose-1-phosphate uridylyltransferase [candidate division Zixibacteria bacterium]|nr:galactose-1-phosphate uridylyltransferase [candidate division Zixibacteria bacterium]